MSDKPGRLTLKDREGHVLLTVTTVHEPARHIVVSVGNCHVILESSAGVRGLADHLRRVGVWMLQQETASHEAIDEVESVFNALRDFANRSQR